MKLSKWDTPFFNVEWLVCDHLVRINGEFTEISVTEHHVIPPEPITEPIEDPVERLIAESSPIVQTADSVNWRVRFENAIAMRIEPERYRHNKEWPRLDEPGNSFIFENSSWIDEFAEEFEDLEPGSRHYVLFTSHEFIEVISRNPPEITDNHSNEVGFLARLRKTLLRR
ncbi:MAG: hypothetical protein IPM63_14740 [Acidobacteriota bacterium]|nr:MAG: hypothetical protein IPM63_14740 [Acidobacteriota bacterium]